MKDVRIWRVANSAQWVAWGIVQAKVPELDDGKFDLISEPSTVASPALTNGTISSSPVLVSSPENIEDPVTTDAVDKETDAEVEASEEADEFDYLAYAQDRAMFFWGDMVSLGVVKPEDLPKETLERVRILDY